MPAEKSNATRKPLKPGPDGIVRLSGGNPQIAKGEGDAVVQQYIAAMPGWQSAAVPALFRRLALIELAVLVVIVISRGA